MLRVFVESFMLSILMILILFATSLEQTFASEESDYYAVSDFYLERAKTFSCDFIQAEVASLEKLHNQEVIADLRQNISELEQEIKQTKNKKEKKELKRILKGHIKILKQKDPKQYAIKSLKNICIVARGISKGIAQPISITNTVIFRSAVVPFSMSVSYIKGAFTRGEYQEKSSGFLYRAFGPKRGNFKYLLSSMVSHLPDFIWGFNPFFFAFEASQMIEVITNYRCYEQSLYQDEESQFCQLYSDIQTFYKKGDKKAYDAGKKLQNLLDQKAMEKRSEISNQEFCQYSEDKQLKLARKTLQRRIDITGNKDILRIEILPPIQKNECTLFVAQVENQEIQKSLQSSLTTLEGIEIVILAPGDKLQKLYTDDEKAKLSFEEKLCLDVEYKNFSKHTTSKMPLYESYFKAMLAPSILSEPEFSEVVVEDQQLRSSALDSLKNKIFILALSNQEKEEVERLEKERELLSEKIKHSLKKILKQDDYKSCIQAVSKLKTNKKEFENDLKRLSEISASPLLKTKDEQETVIKYMKKTDRLNGLKLDWELVETNSIQAIHEALRSIDIGNAVILSHGRSSGHLIDSLKQEFPKESFTALSPTLMSLSFYSCHSQGIDAIYNIKSKLASGESIYKQKFLTTVKENDFLGSDSYAPIAAFGEYIYRVDYFLTQAQKGAKALQENFGSEFEVLSAQNMCAMNVSNLVINSGSYAIVLNDNFVGTMDSSGKDASFEYQCDIFQDKNSLKIKNITSTGGSTIDFTNEFTIEMSGTTLSSAQASYKKDSLVMIKF